jgi:hypothetical protein
VIIWGRGCATCVAGEAGVRDCPVCQNAQRFDFVVSYSYAHIWYLFSWVTSRKYMVICSRCHNGVVIPAHEFQSQVRKDPIPLWRRYGWTLILAILGLVTVVGIVQSKQKDAELTEALITPHVGDVYFADLSKVVNGFGESPAYGALRLTSIGDDELAFAVAKKAYSDKAGVGKDVQLLESADYYDAADGLSLTPDELRHLSDTHVIYGMNHPVAMPVVSDSAAFKDATAPASESAPPTGDDNAALVADYQGAVKRAIQMNWRAPDNTPASPCKVLVTQLPGGHVTKVEVDEDCPYDDAGKRSVIAAVHRADPLPYKGYEKVFNPTGVIVFALPSDASKATP